MDRKTDTRALPIFVTVLAAALLVAFLCVPQGFAAQNDSTLKAGAVEKTVKPLAAKKVAISQCSISLPSSLSYTAQPLKPAPTVTYRGKKLVNGKNYTVWYKNNKGIGTATVGIVGKGDYTGSVTRNFQIKYSNDAIAVAACRLSYSKSRIKGRAVSKGHGYRGTVMYQKYAPSKHKYTCSKIVRTSISRYLRLDTSYPGGSALIKKYMDKSKYWVKICRYRKGMEFKKNTILRPGDVYNAKDHSCIYVGGRIAGTVYNDYLRASSATKSKLKKMCADLGKPGRKAVWVSSHMTYMNGSAAHICGPGDALVNSHRGYIYRYVGPGSTDPNGVTR